jgi:amino acid adenylation domain-containing protein
VLAAPESMSVDTSSDTTSVVMQRLSAADGPKRTWEPDETLDRLISDRASGAADAIAVIDGGVETTYRSLIERATEFTEMLRERSIARGARIGVCADPSVELVACVLAIWAVGAVYVPLDPVLSKSRFDFVVKDADISLILVHRAYQGRVGTPAIIIDERPREARRRFTTEARLEDAACIVYTSGSTGEPKGVELGHAALANAIRASNEMCSLGVSDRQLYRTSIAFDVALYEMLGPLVAGGAVVIAPRDMWSDPRATLELIGSAAITAISVSSSFLALLLDEPGFGRCPSLRLVTSGTDAMSAGLCARFFAVSSAELYNGYGPSEATIVVSAHRCVAADADSDEETAPLGSALANTHVSVRNADLVPVEPGSVGEIVIGGVQLASGYINRPAETAERFVHDPFRPGERLYRTGDLARLKHDGTIVFLGRNDKQVKIRGHRVEPAEIAAALERRDGVRTAVVLARPRNAADPRSPLMLVAYVAARAGVSLQPQVLRGSLRDELPDAMVPAEIVVVEAFPLTLTGKIDEKALSVLKPVGTEKNVVPAATQSLRGIMHEQLRVVWEELLQIDGIGDHDDFYDLGGDSLLAARLITRIEEMFGRNIAFADFFSVMTIAGLGELLSDDSALQERTAVAFNEAGSLAPLVFLHGDIAGGMYAWSLAKLLGSDQPMLVIPPHGMRGRPAASDVSSMAADVCSVIAQHVPSGPLCIAGYSAAGTVAYEAACMLHAAGRDVRDVVVIGIGAERVAFAGLDAVMRGIRLPSAVRNSVLRTSMRCVFKLERFVRLGADERLSRLRRLFRARRAERAALRVGKAIESSDAYRCYLDAHETYIPQPYAGRVTILWPSEQIVQNGDVQRDWSRVAPRVTVVPVPGSHHESVSRHIAEIANALRAQFARAYQ